MGDKLEIIIHIDSKKIDRNLKAAIDEYTKRTSPYCRVTIKQYKSINKAAFKTSSRIFKILPGTASPTSLGLAELIQNINMEGVSCIEFIISNAASDIEAVQEFNLSSFDMSLELTAVVLTEQIYRAYTIMNNITYHK